MGLQILIFLLLFGGVQGLIFSLFLVRKKLHQTAYLFLLLYIGVLILQITLKVMSKVWLMDNWPVIYSFSHYLPLLYGPLIFLFAKHLFQDSSFRSKELIHFLPSAIVLAFFFCDAFNALPQFLAIILFNPFIRLTVIMISLATYHIQAYKIISQPTTRNPQPSTLNPQPLTLSPQPSTTWCRQFVIGSAAVTTVVALALFILYILYPNGQEFRYAFLALSIFIYWLTYSALISPAAFSVIRGNIAPDNSTDFTIPTLSVYRPNEKYANSTLGVEEAAAISARLYDLMQREKLYLQQHYSINQLADALQCSRHHLSQVLNDKLRLSYNDYMNSLRINEACRLLHEPQYHQYKISSIAYDSGFNSLSTFNEVFKKFTGKTPSDYRKEMLKAMQKQRV